MSRIHELIKRGRALPLREMASASLLLSSLHDLGWHRSVREHQSVAADGAATPWWTYAATAWLRAALNDTQRVFEFGSGGSTSWLAERVASVHSVEHDPLWERTLRRDLPANAHLNRPGFFGGS